MNNLNYASLEASKRLVDAGIVLETEAHWIRVANSPMMLVENRYGADEHYPAPSMAEVWKELPNTYSTDTDVRLKTLMSYQAGYKALKDDVGVWFSYDTNPTDALIDLLIFIRKEKP